MALNLVAAFAAQASIGVGRTWLEAHTHAQMNAWQRQQAAKLGQALREVSQEKAELTLDIAAAREAYWKRAAAGSDLAGVEMRYRELLWRKDLHYLTVAMADALKPFGRRGPIRGVGSLMDVATLRIDGGIHAYARETFDGWTAVTIQALLNKPFEAAMEESASAYADYIARRDVAEYLFKSASSPLRSTNNDEYLVGFLLASESSATPAEAQQRSQAMRRLVGKNAFDRAVDDARQHPQPNHYHGDRLDWIATRHDPQLYAIQLIKRWTRQDWDWAVAAHKARVARLGDDAAQAVRAAFESANEAGAPCVGDPDRQRQKTAYLYDCVAERLGPQVLWNDAFDIALANMNRREMRAQMLRELARVRGEGSPEERYARITAVVAEPVLLAAMYQKNNGGVPPLVGTDRRRAPNYGPFGEEMRLIEVFGALHDARSFAVACVAQADRPREKGFVDVSSLDRLERAVTTYEKLVETRGADAVNSVATRIHENFQKLPKTLPKLPIFDGWGEFFLQQLGGV
ncbi:MAG TPA: hypothetical protein VEO54_24815 [Thermoanaerobaculia bacterium]|nr:hypothetical protein [Thermoanaerobaculia bacterium]